MVTRILLSPTLTISTSTSRYIGPNRYAKIAAHAALAGVDIDLTANALLKLALRRSSSPITTFDTAAIWLPDSRSANRSVFGSLANHDHIIDMVERLGPKSLVLDPPGRVRSSGTDSRSIIRAVRELKDSKPSVNLVLRSYTLSPGRTHLAEMTALRRAAEEWDFGLALDLSGYVDPRWEVEAAIQRVLPRLRSVRMGGSLSASRTSVQQRIAHRLVDYLIDQQYAGTISLVPARTWYSPFSAAAISGDTAADAAFVRGRFSRIHETELPQSGVSQRVVPSWYRAI